MEHDGHNVQKVKSNSPDETRMSVASWRRLFQHTGTHLRRAIKSALDVGVNSLILEARRSKIDHLANTLTYNTLRDEHCLSESRQHVLVS